MLPDAVVSLSEYTYKYSRNLRSINGYNPIEINPSSLFATLSVNILINGNMGKIPRIFVVCCTYGELIL